MPTAPSEDEVISWFDSLSNWGRWGPDDELGTLNLITPEVRKKAVATVTDGLTVSCSWDVPPGPLGFEGQVSAVDLARDTKGRIGWSLEHISALVFHGYAITHLDALCHIFWDGHMYNGRATGLVSDETGAQALAITSDSRLSYSASKLAALALEARLPTVCEQAEMAREGSEVMARRTISWRSLAGARLSFDLWGGSLVGMKRIWSSPRASRVWRAMVR